MIVVMITVVITIVITIVVTLTVATTIVTIVITRPDGQALHREDLRALRDTAVRRVALRAGVDLYIHVHTYIHICYIVLQYASILYYIMKYDIIVYYRSKTPTS